MAAVSVKRSIELNELKRNRMNWINWGNWMKWAISMNSIELNQLNELIEWTEWTTWTERIARLEWIESDWDPLGEVNQNELNEVCNRDVYGTMVLRFRPTIRIVPQIYRQKHNGILTNQWERGWRHGLTNHGELTYWLFIDSTKVYKTKQKETKQSSIILTTKT